MLTLTGCGTIISISCFEKNVDIVFAGLICKPNYNAMRTFPPLFILLLAVLSCSNHSDSFETDHITEMFPNIYLSSETQIYVDNRGNPVTEDVETHHENGNLHADLSFKDGIIVSGSLWDIEGQLRTVYTVEDGLPVITYLYESGQPSIRFQFEGDMKNIVASKSWFEDGARKFKTTKEVHKVWHENGQLTSKVPRINGRANGVGYAWYENGELAAENHYKDDQLHGSSRSWNENKNLVSEKFYDMGMPDGVHKIWDSHGNLIEEKMYKAGKPHGTHTKWDGAGNILEETVFEDGQAVAVNRN